MAQYSYRTVFIKNIFKIEGSYLNGIINKESFQILLLLYSYSKGE